MKHTWRKAASGLLALTLATGSLPVNMPLQDLFSGAVLTAYAEVTASGECGENVTWSLEDGVLTISGTGAMEDYDIAPWYNDRSGITEAVIESGVTSIGNYTISGCTSLTSITIPDSVISIGDGAFNACENLTSVTIPDSVTSIGDYAFNSCRKLISVVITGDSTALGETVFDGTPDTMQIYVPAAKQADYKSAENWSNYADKIIGYTDTKLPDGQYKQTASRVDFETNETTYYTRYVFVVPETDFAGKSAAKFTVTDGRDHRDYTFTSHSYYTGVISNGITYTPASDSNKMFVVTVTSGSDISADLTCKLDFE